MKSVRIAAAQTREFPEDVEGALAWLTDVAARAEGEGAALLCFPEGFLQGYLVEEVSARRHALDLGSPAFAAVLDRMPKTGPVIVLGLIEIEAGGSSTPPWWWTVASWWAAIARRTCWAANGSSRRAATARCSRRPA